jgi:hypothetical protein
MPLWHNEERFKTPGVLRCPVELSEPKKVGKKHSLLNVWLASFLNAESPVATIAVNTAYWKLWRNAEE